jgi:hypothetical protein
MATTVLTINKAPQLPLPNVPQSYGLLQRLINITITLAQNTQMNQPNTFSESGTDTVTLSGSRTSVRIENSGSPVGNSAQVKIWGMTPSLMNQLATLGLVFNLVPKNALTVQAGDATNGMSTVFTGTIVAAYGDYSSQPDVPFVFECNSGLINAVVSVPPTSFPRPFSVATAMAGFARQMNVGFLNSGNVQVTLPPSYFNGSLKDQIQKCADNAHIQWTSNSNTLEIWPNGGSRTTPSVPTISPQTGMVSYPAFTQQGIIVKTLFNPLLSFGGLVSVQSSLLAAIASAQPTQQPILSSNFQPPSTFPTQWAINKLDLALDSLLPHGDWLSIVYGYNPGYAKTILPPA